MHSIESIKCWYLGGIWSEHTYYPYMNTRGTTLQLLQNETVAKS